MTLTATDYTSRSMQGALDAAVEFLRSQQDPQGWWKGELETNVTMDAEDLLLREFLGIREKQETEEAARWIRSQQRADGTWANFRGGPGDLSTTIEAWVARNRCSWELLNLVMSSPSTMIRPEVIWPLRGR